MTSQTENHSAANQQTSRAQRLRGTLGVRSPSTWCLVEGCRIAVEEVADESHQTDAQPVVCLHTAGSGSREFRPLLTRRPIGSRLILLDWPSHGRSGQPGASDLGNDNSKLTVENSARQLHSILNQLGLRKPLLLGSGYGAAVAIRYTADHPARIQGLILCQPAGLVPESAPANGVHKFASSMGGLKPNCMHLLPGQSKYRTSNTPGRTPAERQQLRMAILKPAMLTAISEAATSLQQSELSLQTALGKLHCPILFALSRKNRQYPLRKYLSLLDPLLSAAPQHRFTVFSGDFHPLWDESDRFAQALTAFVQAQLPVSKHQHAWLLTAVDWPTGNSNLWKCVHPECRAERVLPASENANETP